LTPNELVTFGGSYVCANFGENRSRNVTVRLLADGHTDRRKPIFIALHGMQTRSSDGNSICLCVRLSCTSFVSGVVDRSRSVMSVLYSSCCNISHILVSTRFKAGEFGGHSWGGI